MIFHFTTQIELHTHNGMHKWIDMLFPYSYPAFFLLLFMRAEFIDRMKDAIPISKHVSTHRANAVR